MSTTLFTGIVTVGIPVRDQDVALDFYTRVLGFELLSDQPVPQLGSRWIIVAPTGSATTISLVAKPDGEGVGGETGIRFATPDADAVHAHLRSNNVEVGELLRWPGVPPMFRAFDPDGNAFEVVEVG